MDFNTLFNMYRDQVVLANDTLLAQGLPSLLISGNYTLENTPRIIWKWRPIGFHLDQLYLKRTRVGDTINILNIASGEPYVQIV